MLLRDPSGPDVSNIWLRLLGAVHRLVLDHPSCPLGGLLPTAGGTAEPARVGPEVIEFVEGAEAEVAAELPVAVQTNEVARSAVLSASMNWLGGDLHLLEVGASAGLNLWLDRWRVVAPGVTWGPPDSPVVLAGQFEEGTPPPGPFRVVSRAGCDIHPLDPHDRADVRILRSFVWPDHPERLRRLELAMRSSGRLVIDPADAVDWTARKLDHLPEGRTVVYHSILRPYLASERFDELRSVIEKAGSRTTQSRRLAWVFLEGSGGEGSVDVTARRWPEGDSDVLATCTPHATGIRWTAPRPKPG